MIQIDKNILKKKRNLVLAIIFASLIIFAAYISFYNLGSFPLENWDEAWYGDIIRNMMRTGDFIVLYWNNQIFLDKPPMYMWISVLFSKFFGLSELSIRLTSAISGFTIIVWILIYSYKEFKLIPSLLAFSAIVFNNIFIWRTRSGNIDVFVSLLILATYFVLIGKSKYKYCLLGLLFACIYLAKASLVFFPLSIFLLHELLFQTKKIRKNFKEYLRLFAIFIVLSGAWLLLGIMKSDLTFIKYFVFHSDQGVANLSLAELKLDYLQYAYYSLQRRLFWVFILGILFSLRKIATPKYFLLLLYSCLLLIGLSFTDKKNNWYLIPSMPFWSILIAYGTYSFFNLFNKHKFVQKTVILMVIVLFGYVSYRTYTINIRAVLESQTTLNQAKASTFLNQVSEQDDIIVRLDHLYPTTIYYSDRQTLSSPSNAGTSGIFISRSDLIKSVRLKEIEWIIGKEKEIDIFSKNLTKSSWEIVKTEGDEQVLRIKER